MTQDQHRELDRICRKLQTLNSTADLTPDEKRRFELLVEVWDAEEQAAYASSQLSSFLGED